ncbi:MAG: hypothetical protein V8Q36_05595 [Anaerotignum sp.]
MVQVFYPNLHYYRTEEISAEETSVESSVEKGIASAMLYRRGAQTSAWSMPYMEPSDGKGTEASGKADDFCAAEGEKQACSPDGGF